MAGEPKEKKKVGRPSLYKEEYNKLAYKFCLLGATDEELGIMFDVEKSTIENWKNEFPEFMDSIKKGKEIADAKVASRLYQRALGYEHKEDQIFQYQGTPLIVPTKKHYPPDPTSAIFWLKNRRPKDWRDKVEVDHSNKGKEFQPNTNIDLSKLSDAALREIINAARPQESKD